MAVADAGDARDWDDDGGGSHDRARHAAAAGEILPILEIYARAHPDREHRFGHGKALALAAWGQATLIAGSAGFLALESIDRLLRPPIIGRVWDRLCRHCLRRRRDRSPARFPMAGDPSHQA